MAFCGAVLLLVALSSAYIKRLPMTTSFVYLILGLALSPIGFNVLEIDVLNSKSWLERLTEIAVIVSLFIGGLKLRLPVSDKIWSTAFRLAGPVMVLSILGAALFAHVVLGLDLALSLLLGAILAPTDPVLASEVSVNDAEDEDRMRYALSGEAGFNDGMAFPFVVLGIELYEKGNFGAWVGEWALHRLIWAVPAGLLLGFFLGKYVGRLAIWLRNRHRETSAPNDFFALALIAIAYASAETIGAWGFLAVFAAGLGLRRAETKIVADNPHPEIENRPVETRAENAPDGHDHPPAENFVGNNVGEEELEKPSVAAGVLVSDVLSFGETAERLMEILLIVIVGVCLAVHWDARAVLLAAALFFIIRPAASFLCLIKTPTGKIQRGLIGWFGIRGIGSLYYLAYALNHGISDETAVQAVNLTISVVAISIVIHGLSAQPVLDWYEKQLKRQTNS